MPNGAIAEAWTVLGSWDGDEEYAFAGDWSPYGLRFDEKDGLLVGAGSQRIYEVLEDWVRQERGTACATCRCSGRIAAYPFVSVHDSWLACPECLGAGRIPPVPEERR